MKEALGIYSNIGVLYVSLNCLLSVVDDLLGTA